MHRGYTCLWRKFWDNKNFYPKGHVFSRGEAFLYLVNHEARGQDDPESGLLRGQFEASCRRLAKVWNWPKSVVHRFLIELVGNGDIARLGQSAGQSAGQEAGRFSICKYELYNPTRDTKRDRKRDTKRDTYKEGLKKDKKSPSDSLLFGGNGDRPPSTDPGILLWIYQHNNQHLGPVRAFSRDRREKCRTRLHSAQQEGLLEAYLADFEAAVKKAQLTPFLCGAGEKGWIANFDWLIANDRNVQRILEGFYDGIRPRPGGKQSTIDYYRDLFDGMEDPNGGGG